jgi:probable phosphoglycerate mutase
MDSTTAVPQPTLGSDAGNSCSVLLIRHGRSADVVPGSAESGDPPLHVIGVTQAERLRARLAPMRIDAVYSSHLTRARQTATPLAHERGLDVIEYPDLEEFRLGDWANGEFRRRASVADPEFVAWARTGRWDGIPGAESDADFRGRVSSVVDVLAAQHMGETIAVVAHGGTISAYLAHVFDIHRSLWMTVENTSISLVRLHTDGATVVAVNDCHHLYDPVLGQP